jgi:hypothetical protein
MGARYRWAIPDSPNIRRVCVRGEYTWLPTIRSAVRSIAQDSRVAWQGLAPYTHTVAPYTHTNAQNPHCEALKLCLSQPVDTATIYPSLDADVSCKH